MHTVRGELHDVQCFCVDGSLRRVLVCYRDEKRWTENES